MRELEFLIDGSKLSPVGDFTNIVRGTKGALKLKFELESDDDTIAIAVFNRDREEYAVKLDENNSCIVPDEVMDYPCFKVKIVFSNRKVVAPTNELLIRLEG